MVKWEVWVNKVVWVLKAMETIKWGVKEGGPKDSILVVVSAHSLQKNYLSTVYKSFCDLIDQPLILSIHSLTFVLLLTNKQKNSQQLILSTHPITCPTHTPTHTHPLSYPSPIMQVVPTTRAAHKVVVILNQVIPLAYPFNNTSTFFHSFHHCMPFRTSSGGYGAAPQPAKPAGPWTEHKTDEGALLSHITSHPTPFTHL